MAFREQPSIFICFSILLQAGVYNGFPPPSITGHSPSRQPPWRWSSRLAPGPALTPLTPNWPLNILVRTEAIPQSDFLGKQADRWLGPLASSKMMTWWRSVTSGHVSPLTSWTRDPPNKGETRMAFVWHRPTGTWNNDMTAGADDFFPSFARAKCHTFYLTFVHSSTSNSLHIPVNKMIRH